MIHFLFGISVAPWTNSVCLDVRWKPIRFVNSIVEGNPNPIPWQVDDTPPLNRINDND